VQEAEASKFDFMYRPPVRGSSTAAEWAGVGTDCQDEWEGRLRAGQPSPWAMSESSGTAAHTACRVSFVQPDGMTARCTLAHGHAGRHHEAKPPNLLPERRGERPTRAERPTRGGPGSLPNTLGLALPDTATSRTVYDNQSC
jgi:hypothetical protein